MVQTLRLQVNLYLFDMPGGEERTDVVPEASPVVVLGEINSVIHVSNQTEVLRQTGKKWAELMRECQAQSVG